MGVLCMCALVAVAQADVQLSIFEVDNADVPAGDGYDANFFGTVHHTYDIFATVTGGDDWIWSQSEVSAFGPAAFYEHPLEQPNQAPPIPFDGSLKYDTYYRSPGMAGGVPVYEAGPTASSDYLDAIWNDSVWMGDGEYLLMRFTISVPEDIMPVLNGPGDALVTGYLEAETDFGAYRWIDFSIAIPEPSSVGLLIALALIAARRRK